MMVLSYDVSNTDTGGARRLRRLARACLDYGQRVQLSVFEIEVDTAQWVALKARLEETIDPAGTVCGSTIWVGNGAIGSSMWVRSRCWIWMRPWCFRESCEP